MPEKLGRGNRTNHKKKFVHWDDWEAFMLKLWFPFQKAHDEWRTNDWVHLVEKVNGIGTNQTWIKWLLCGMVLILLAAAIAILAST